MAFVETANITRSRSLALQGALFTAALVVFSFIDLRFAGITLSFLWLPLIGVYLWPRGSETSSSTVLLMLTGLFFDVVSDGMIGVWALIFLATFLIVRPNKRSRNTSFSSLWIGFVTWTVILVLGIWAIQAIFIKVNFSVLSVFLQWGPVLLAFPVVYWLSQFARRIVTDPSERVY